MLIELCDKIIDCIDLLVIRYFINDFNRFCKIFKIWWTYCSLKFNDVQVKENFWYYIYIILKRICTGKDMIFLGLN